MFNAYSICWHITYVLKLCSAVAVVVCLFVGVVDCLLLLFLFVCVFVFRLNFSSLHSSRRYIGINH